jgi:hypothetical protein
MTFTRANPGGWVPNDPYTSAQANQVDINQSRAIDGFAGGTFSPSAIITLNQEIVIDATAAVGANATALTLTGKGNEPGISSTGGATSASGGVFTGGAPNGNGLNGIGTGSGWGINAIGGATGGGVRGEGQGGGIGVVGVGEGAAAGVSGTGGLTGNGVAGQGGGTSGFGVYGHGTATDPGVRGEGGHTDGAGVEGIGGATNGIGVKGTGAGSGAGINGTGSAAGSHGVIGNGTGTGVGVRGLGGPTNAAGGQFSGGGANGIGAIGTGAGSGTGISGTGGASAPGVTGVGGATGVGGKFTGGANGAAITLVPRAGVPSTQNEGDIWFETGTDQAKIRMNTANHVLIPTWCTITTDGASGITLVDQNNVSGVSLIDGGGANTRIRITFQDVFQSANYAVSAITLSTSNKDWFPTIYSAANANVDISIWDVTTGLVDPDGEVVELRVIIQGEMN